MPCDVEHADGVLRNNIVIDCSDVGVYLNRAASTRVLYNTLIGTAGIDFRFATTTGEAVGNVLTGAIRMRDDGTFTGDANLEGATFTDWYADPLGADLTPTGDLAALIGQGPARAEVPDDYCARDRPDGAYTLGAIEHAAGDCAIVPPPGGSATPEPEAGCGCGGDDRGGLLALLVVLVVLAWMPCHGRRRA